MTLSGSRETFFDTVRPWWSAHRSRCERTAMLLLVLCCITNIFSTAIVQIVVVVWAALLLGCFAFTRSFTFRRTPLDLPYFAFVLARLLSVPFSDYPEQSLPAIHIEFFFYIVFFLLTQTVRRNEVTTTRLLASLYIGAGVIAALIGIAKLALHLEPRGSSTTAGAYTLGAYLCIALPLNLFLPGRREEHHPGRWLISFLLCAGILSTFDRLHWAAMGGTLLLAGLLFRNRSHLIALSAALALCLITPLIRLRIEQMGDFHTLMNGRDVLWKGAMMLISRHPFVGFGPRTFTKIFPLFNDLPTRGVGSWHNDYVQVYMESGLVGLFALLWLIVAVCFWGWRALRSRTLSHDERWVFVSLLTSFVVLFLVGGLLDTLVGIVFRVLLGLFALLLRPLWNQTMGDVEADVPSR